MIYQISFMDTGNTLGNDRFYTQIHGINSRMLTGGTLSIVFTADDDALSHFFRTGCKFRIIAVIAILGHQRNIGTHAAELSTCRCNIIGGYIITGF